MAKLMLIGKTIQVELVTNDEDDFVVAKCALHPSVMRDMGKPCRWIEEYDTLNDAVEYAADHADGRR